MLKLSAGISFKLLITKFKKEELMPYFIADKAEIFYKVTGKGQPVVILGSLVPFSGMWSKSFEPLKDNFCFITISYRGQEPTKVDGLFTLTDIVYDIKNIIEKLGYKKVSIIGDVLGCLVATCFANTFPKMVAKLILSGTTYAKYLNIKYRLKTWENIRKKAENSISHDMLKSKLHSSNCNTNNMPNIRLSTKTDSDKKNMLLFFNAIFSATVSAEYDLSNHPTLIIQSFNQNKLQTPAEDKAKVAVKEAEYKYIEINTDHVPVTEDNKDLTEIIMTFLSK